MQKEKSIQNTLRDYGLKTAGIALFLSLLTFAILYYVSTSRGHDGMPQLIKLFAKNTFGVNIDFEDYETRRSEDFPFLSFRVNGLFIEGSDCIGCRSDLLEVESIQFKIHPWNFFSNEITVKDIRINNGQFRFEKGKKGHRNTEFLQKLKREEVMQGGLSNSTSFTFNLDTIFLNNVLLEYTDAEKEKFYGIDLHKGTLLLNQKDEYKRIKLKSDCTFSGLMFKKENGAFLKGKSGETDFDISLAPDSVLIQNSSLRIDSDTLAVHGYLLRDAVPFLDLHISSPGILLENARTLTDDKLQRVLSDFYVEKPVSAHFHLTNRLNQGEKPKINLSFESSDTDFEYKNIQITDTDFSAAFSNNCLNSTESDLPPKGCLTIHNLCGHLYDTHSINLSGHIDDLKQLTVRADANVILDLAALQAYLNTTDLQLKAGKAHVNIDYSGNIRNVLSNKTFQKSNFHANIQMQDAELAFEDLQFQHINGRVSTNAQKTRMQKLSFDFNENDLTLSGTIGNLLPYILRKSGKLRADVLINSNSIDLSSLINNTDNKKEKTQTPASLGAQLSSIIQPIQKLIYGRAELHLGSVRYDNIEASNTHFTLKLNNDKTENDTVFLSVSDFSTSINDSININGNFYLHNTEAPSLHSFISLNSPAEQLASFINSPSFYLASGTIQLSDNRQTLLNEAKTLRDILKQNHYFGTVQINKLAGHLQDTLQHFSQLNASINYDSTNVLLQQFNGNFAGLDFQIDGQIQDYLLLLDTSRTNKRTIVDLNVLLNDFAPEKIRFSDKPVALTSALKSLIPYVEKTNNDISIKAKKVLLPSLPLQDLSLHLKNTEDKKGQHSLLAQKVQGTLYSNTPIRADIKIENLTAPQLILKANSNIPATDLNQLLNYDNIKVSRGATLLDFFYKNALIDSFDIEHYLLNGKLSGRLDFQNSEINYIPRGLNFNHINGHISFTERSVNLDFQDLFFNENKGNITGYSDDFLPFFFEKNHDFTIALDLESPHVDFAKFDTPQTLKTQNGAALKTKLNQEKTSKVLHRLFTEGKLQINSDLDTIRYDQFEATDLIGRLHMTNNEAILDTIRMKSCSGIFGIHGKLSDIDKEEISMAVKLNFSDIDATEVFHSFNNFNQDVLTDKNINGITDADIEFSAVLNDNYEVQGETMKGALDLELREGAFIDFSGLKNLDGFLFKKRHLDSVYFEKLNTHITLDSRDMSFTPFTLNSTAATLNVAGVYTFSQEDRTDLTIEIPLGNIFKRYMERGEIRKKRRGGIPIYVRVKEQNKVLNFSVKLKKKE